MYFRNVNDIVTCLVGTIESGPAQISENYLAIPDIVQNISYGGKKIPESANENRPIEMMPETDMLLDKCFFSPITLDSFLGSYRLPMLDDSYWLYGNLSFSLLCVSFLFPKSSSSKWNHPSISLSPLSPHPNLLSLSPNPLKIHPNLHSLQTHFRDPCHQRGGPMLFLISPNYKSGLCHLTHRQRLAYIGAMWRCVAQRFSLDFRSKWLRCGLAEKRCVAGRCVA